MEKKVTKTFSYDSEVIDDAKKNPLIQSFAKWACEKYREEFMNLATLQEHKEVAEVNLKFIENQIKYVEQNNKKEKLSILKSHEENWIRDYAEKRIRRSSFEGVYKFFIARYGRGDINRTQFRLLVDKYSR